MPLCAFVFAKPGRDVAKADETEGNVVRDLQLLAKLQSAVHIRACLFVLGQGNVDMTDVLQHASLSIVIAELALNLQRTLERVQRVGVAATIQIRRSQTNQHGTAAALVA